MTPTGTVDASWNSSAAYTFNAGQNETVSGAIAQPSGAVVLSISSSVNTTFLRVFPNGTRDTSFCVDGSVTVNASAFGAIGKFAINSQNALVGASIIWDPDVSLDAHYVVLDVQDAAVGNRMVNHTGLVALQPRIATTSIITDPQNASRVYVGGHIDVSQDGPLRSVIVASIDLASDSVVPRWGYPNYTMPDYLIDTISIDAVHNHYLSQVIPQGSGVLLVYSREEASLGVFAAVIERRLASGERDSSWGSSGFVVSTPAILAIAPRASIVPATGDLFVAGATMYGHLWRAGVAPTTGAAAAAWTPQTQIDVQSPDAVFQLVDTVEQVLAVGSDVFVVVNVRKLSGEVAGALWKFDSAGQASVAAFGSNGLSRLSPPAPYTSSYAMTALMIPGDARYVYVGGSAKNDSTQVLMISRINATSGAIDTSFGTNGFLFVTSAKDSSGYIRKMLWDSPKSRIALFGASADPFSSLRVAAFLLDPATQAFDCMLGSTVGMHRWHGAFVGVTDALRVGAQYLVTVSSPQRLKYVRFSDDELATCRAYCGDGLKEADEWCDDGNTAAGDGCSSWCTTEPGWVCRTPGAPCN